MQRAKECTTTATRSLEDMKSQVSDFILDGKVSVSKHISELTRTTKTGVEQLEKVTEKVEKARSHLTTDMVDVKTKIISEENDAVKKGITAMTNKIDNTAAFQQLADARKSITDDLEAQ